MTTTNKEKAVSFLRLLKLMWDISPRHIIVLGIVVVLQGLLPVSGALIVREIVNEVAALPDAQTSLTDSPPAVRLLVLGIGIAVAIIVLRSVEQLLTTTFSERVVPDMNMKLVKKAVRLDHSFFEQPRFYDMLFQAQSEIGRRPLMIIQEVPKFAKNLVTLAGFLIILLNFNVLLTLLLIATGLPTTYFENYFSRALFNLTRKQTPIMRWANYYRTLLTSVTSAAEVRIFRLKDILIDRFYNHLLGVQNAKVRLARQRILVLSPLEILTVLIYWGVFAWIINSTMIGRLTLGDLVLFSSIFLQVNAIIAGVQMSIRIFNESALFISHFFGFLDLQESELPPSKNLPVPSEIQEGIVFKDVTFYYPESNRPALRDINLHIRPGETLAIVGDNGAGKSTLVKLIARLYHPSKGSITLDGIPLHDYDLEEYYRQFSAISQDFVQYSLSVQDNIGFGYIEELDNHDLTRQAANISGADEFIETLEDGYGTLLGRIFDDSTQLSRGQWQKLSLARAYIKPSQILILDEPTAALDVKTEAKVIERYNEEASNKIAILISHRFGAVRHADRIIVLENGRIIENGTHDELMALDGLYAMMFNLQMNRFTGTMETLLDE
ncbi:MAG: ABC transporter ATP-binding protein/permease [Chloroflexi bacterium]|nr:ABC transporter ATP-binding protein/permease [Chloroflexota bacterium]